jgi:hypothetical protein
MACSNIVHVKNLLARIEEAQTMQRGRKRSRYVADQRLLLGSANSLFYFMVHLPSSIFLSTCLLLTSAQRFTTT